MLISQFSLFLSAIGFGNALSPSKRAATYAVKERHDVPPTWQRIGPASKRDVIQLAIGLKQQNEGQIEEHLLQVSDPKHERYGKHLSADEVRNIVRPAVETMELVEEWLSEHGVSDYAYNHANDMIHCTVPIGTAEEMLQTEYHEFQHDDGSTANRAPVWSLPQHLHEHIDIVQPTTSFFHPKKELVPGDNLYESADYSAAQNKPEGYGVPSNGGSKGTSSSGGYGSIVDSNEGTPKRSSATHGQNSVRDTSGEDIGSICNSRTKMSSRR